MATKPATGSPAESIKWLDKVADHDYAAAAGYLSIKLGKDAVQKMVKRLKAAPLVTRRANDVLRAAGLEPAPLSDPGVHKDLVKVLGGNALSPILVVTVPHTPTSPTATTEPHWCISSTRTQSSRSSSPEDPQRLAEVGELADRRRDVDLSRGEARFHDHDGLDHLTRLTRPAALGHLPYTDPLTAPADLGGQPGAGRR